LGVNITNLFSRHKTGYFLFLRFTCNYGLPNFEFKTKLPIRTRVWYV